VRVIGSAPEFDGPWDFTLRILARLRMMPGFGLVFASHDRQS
jgi:hypothetical protein